MSSCPDIMTDSHWLSNTYAWFALPYFYYDIWAMYQTHLLFHPYLAEKSTWVSIRHYLSRNVVMMVHHVIMPMVFFPIILFLRKDQGDYFIGVFYMIEITIPFIALFTLLVQLKVTEQIYTIIAGLLMVIVFFVSRILVFPFLFWSYSNYANIGFWDVPGSIPIRCNVGCSLLLLPQLYWLVLMVKGAYKVLCKRMALRQVSLVSIGKAHGS
ncbi:ceramide synthase-like [Liolophura sinensis]|uniref:ceramide synthase-like n=1 Tax=Liolophura sinensis TaxID=3198878 RepID=UPI003158C5E1